MAKPGIIYGNDLSALAGFLLASSLAHSFKPALVLPLLLGMSLVIGCGCIINNFIDRAIDARMSRTQKRALVTEQIGPGIAVTYGVCLGLGGFMILALFTNWLTFILGVIGLFFYLVMYSIFKRKSPLGTLVGSVSGAVPITAGYTAVTNRLDAAAGILFLTMAFWQMPHFYAIALYRRRDYKSAGLPVLTLKRSSNYTKISIFVYIAAFTLSAAALTFAGYTGYTYIIIITFAGLAWLYKGIVNFKAQKDAVWGRQMFLLSLIVLLVFSLVVSLGAWLP